MNRIDTFKKIVLDYYHNNVKGGNAITDENVFVVWSCKALQNYKAIIGVYFEDERLFEVTYDGDKNRTYLDVYEKKDQSVISD